MVAAGGGYKTIVENLIANGADVCARNDENLTAIDYANQKYFYDIVKILLYKANGYRPFYGFEDEDITAACAHTEKLLDLRVD